jgi:hypothetical protein
VESLERVIELALAGDDDLNMPTSQLPLVTAIGGRMYGDGEYVVEFHVSELAPLSATILGSSSLRGVEYEQGVEPNLSTARRTIALARHQDGRATFDEAFAVTRGV